jgi:hypothetical protein
VADETVPVAETDELGELDTAETMAQVAKRVVAAMPPRNPNGGRRPLMSARIVRDLFKAVLAGESDLRACAYAGISSDTLYAWVKRGEKGDRGYSTFSAELTKVRARSRTDHLIAIGSDKDWKARAWLLAHQSPDEFGKDVTETRHTGVIATTTVDLVTLAPLLTVLTPEQKFALAGLLPKP